MIKEQNTQLLDVQMHEDHQKTGRLLKTLKIKVGGRVMLTNNIDVTDGLTDGAMETVTQIIYNNSEISVILVKFHNKNVGVSVQMRSKYKHICKDSVQASFAIHHRKAVETTRTQFSLILSWAVTIHKVQELTLDSVVVDMFSQLLATLIAN